ncbi:MAG: tRNA (adenosine(37)-N6)-dimethylallyltransferase MiaA [Phycisphaerae bacterium]|nr:tRNA (adenosine(37)-N6)-dimethylallyltransferase MiaA [Phycisphaerae bacterium]
MTNKNKMILIMGCTASGKGKLAFEIAKRTGGSIISIDSMKVYRRMNIGTAKPDTQRLKEVKHYLIDVVEPSESFSMGRYIELADQAIDQLRDTTEGPIIAAGGTAMYIRGLLEGIFQGESSNPEIRDKLEAQAKEQGLNALFERLKIIDPVSASRIHINDKKRIIRALEVFEVTGKPLSTQQTQFRSGNYRYPWQLIGLQREKTDGNHRMNMRVKKMISDGLIEEVRSLLDEPDGLSKQAAQAVGYAEIIKYFDGQWTLDEAIEKIKINTRRFGKNQRTWYRSFNDVNWFDVAQDQTAEGLADEVMCNFFNP